MAVQSSGSAISCVRASERAACVSRVSGSVFAAWCGCVGMKGLRGTFVVGLVAGLLVGRMKVHGVSTSSPGTSLHVSRVQGVAVTTCHLRRAVNTSRRCAGRVMHVWSRVLSLIFHFWAGRVICVSI